MRAGGWRGVLACGLGVAAAVARPSGASPAAPVPPFAYYAGIVRAVGGTVNRDGRTTVLGLRGRSLDGTRHEVRVVPDNDDTFVVLSPNGTVTTFAGSTHPHQVDDPYPHDVDLDGRPDVGMVKPGRYLVERQDSDIAGAPSFYVFAEDGDYHLPAWENTDHDDRYSVAEQEASDERGDTLVDVLFHSDGPGAPDTIGCQVLGPEDMQAFSDLVGDAFDYVLVDAPDDLFGWIDVATTTGDGRAQLSGWALDLRVDGPVAVHVYVDGELVGATTADRPRTDVAQAFAAYDVSDRRGFTFTTKPGHVCLYLIDALGGPNPLLGCRDVGVDPPIGFLDVVDRTSNGIRVAGWTFDPDAPTDRLNVHLYVDGELAAGTAADRSRVDVGAVFPTAGALHGYDATIPATGGPHVVCAYAINQGPGANPLLGCRTVS